MKKFYSICAALLMTASVFAQTPEKMSYQAIVRDASNKLLTSKAVGMQISILQGSTTGTSVYVETQTPTTNTNGLVSIEIGNGTAMSGTFSGIDWVNGPYFIKTETDPNGGTNYTISGTSQLLSVPYALHAKTADSAPIQTISRTGTTVTLSNGGGTFQDSVGVYKAGKGIQISGNVVSTISHSVGDTFGGGIVFYVYDGGQHGLIAATADQSTGIRWYGGSLTTTGARGDGVGAGLINTAIIIANQGPVDGNIFAARICNEYWVKVGGVIYGDWYLPSYYELNLLYLNRAVVGGFANNAYWSSTEYDKNGAFLQLFPKGTQTFYVKDWPYSVRAVRAF
jgi:hypothetical protein